MTTRKKASLRTEPTPQAEPVPTTKTKLELLVGLLRAPDGASIEQMQAATGWQAHSVRGALAGALKKKLGLTITSTKTKAGRTYRIAEEAGA
ncbi:MAG: DUF3489 domain-containing protein [Phenylobacterium sp.]